MNDKNNRKKQLEQKLIDAAYGVSSGAAIGAGLGVFSTIAVGTLAGSTVGSVIPVFGTVIGGIAGLVGASIIEREEKNESEDNPDN